MATGIFTMQQTLKNPDKNVNKLFLEVFQETFKCIYKYVSIFSIYLSLRYLFSFLLNFCKTKHLFKEEFLDNVPYQSVSNAVLFWRACAFTLKFVKKWGNSYEPGIYNRIELNDTMHARI